MKISEAKVYYKSYLEQLTVKRDELVKEQQKTVEKPNKRELYDRLELEIKELDEDKNSINDYLDKIAETTRMLEDMKRSEEEIEAEKEKWEEYLKILEIFSRLANGDKVPPADEQKLMEADKNMYMAAKNLASLRHNDKPREYKSLWEDEKTEEKPETDVGDMKAPAGEPQINSDVKVEKKDSTPHTDSESKATKR